MRMLIIRPGAIGDTLLTFPLLQALKVQHTELFITFVGNAAVLPLALACNLVNAVSSYEDAKWGKLFQPDAPKEQLSELLGQVDMAICWLRDPQGMVANNLRKIAIPQIVVAPGRPATDKRQPVVAYLAETIGMSWTAQNSVSCILPATTSASIQLPAGCIAIHPGSGGVYKCWPVAHFAAVIVALWQHAVPVLLLAGPADQQRLDDLRHQLPTPPHASLLNLLVDAPLLTVAQHLQCCRAYLGNDSGITHLAAQLGLPTIALFGPSDPVIWRPSGPAVNVISAPMLEKIQVSTVLSQLKLYMVEHS